MSVGVAGDISSELLHGLTRRLTGPSAGTTLVPTQHMFLDARRQKLVERLFEEALEQPADLRTAWLTRACAGDDLVDRETTALLAAHDHAGLFLEVPAFAMRDHRA